MVSQSPEHSREYSPERTREHSNAFVRSGYCVVPAANLDSLGQIRSQLVAGLRAQMKGGEGLTEEAYLNRFHEFADREKLNDIRVKVHKEVGADPAFKKLVYETALPALHDLIGSEVAMQRQVNFVVHMPKDPKALIYLHTDAWAGCSPYEVILWLPLVDVFDTKSMYLCDREQTVKQLKELRTGPSPASATELLKKVRPHAQSLRLKFGQALLFSSILLHGADENLTGETRFILNVRFKSLFSPYGTKGLGETFLPLGYHPATEIGLSYETDFGCVRG